MQNAIEHVLYRFLDAWKNGDIETYVDCLARDFESSHPLGRTTDIGHIRKELELVIEHWRDRDYKIITCVVQGNNVAMEYEMAMTGTGRGFEGRIILPGMILATIQGDRIVRYREEFNPKIVFDARVGAKSAV